MPHREQKLFLQKIEKLIDSLSATAFQKSVWKAALRIPFGRVRSYGWIASKIGRPRAARAVGSALKANRFPVIIPCHRVIKNDGTIGGFAFGRGMKALLLSIEGHKFAALLLVLLFSFNAPCFGRSVWNGNKERNVVALSFDDGPKPEYCIPILETLDKFGAKATFFVIGKEAKLHPDIIMRMDDCGHAIGNHTYTHILAKGTTVKRYLADVQACSDAIHSIIGKRPKFFRPPGGGINQAISSGLGKKGMRTVFWTINASDYTDITPGYEVPEDVQAMARTLARNIVDKVTPGSIILLHSSSEQTVRALPWILQGLKEKGYGLVNVADLVEEKI